MTGMAEILKLSGATPADLGLIIHGTTLATNAIIERKGAKTALLVTAGFRDAIEIAYENRFEQYDIYMERPEPLVSRDLRFGVPERVAADGAVLLALDEKAVRAVAAELRKEKIEAVEAALVTALEAVTTLDEDRILRRFHNAVLCTLRTNYWQAGEIGRAHA